MDTEQYEDAVRDYEKVYQTEKTKGEHKSTLCVCAQISLNWHFCCSFFPPQYAVICSLIPQQDNLEKPSEALEVSGLVSLPALKAEVIIPLVSEAGSEWLGLLLVLTVPLLSEWPEVEGLE